MTRQKLGAWMKFYGADWVASTRELSLAARGAYIDLLVHAWDRGSIPPDRLSQARICACTPEEMDGAWGEIGDRWEAHGSRLTNPKQERVRSEQAARSEKSKEAGARGAASKWGSPETIEKGKQKRSERMAAARARGRHVRGEWEEMILVYGRCLRCGADDAPLVKDHVLPVYRGGSDAITNLQPLCQPCNSSKGPDDTDLRVGLPETWPEWLPGVEPSRAPGETPGERLAPQGSGLRAQVPGLKDPEQQQTRADARGAAADAAALSPDGENPDPDPSPERTRLLEVAARHSETARRLIFEVLCPAGLGQSVIPEALELLQGPKWLEGRGEIETKAILRAKADQAPGKFSPGGWLLQVLRAGDATTPVKPRAPAGARGSPADPAPESPQDPTTATEWEAIASQLDLAADRCEALLPGQAEDLRAQAARAREEAEDLQGAANG